MFGLFVCMCLLCRRWVDGLVGFGWSVCLCWFVIFSRLVLFFSVGLIECLAVILVGCFVVWLVGFVFCTYDVFVCFCFGYLVGRLAVC